MPVLTPFLFIFAAS